MPQVRAKHLRCLVPLTLVLTLSWAPAARALAPGADHWLRPLVVLGDWFLAPYAGVWLAETIPVDPEEEIPIDNVGASMDPAGGHTTPPATGG